ncbi:MULTISPECIES: hypothetical protein [Proteus]|uniref:hypothetical protein n=1 Tax=Proteus TaxID=583 RepID=UPI0018E41205|nr:MULTISPECIES: hypothetical protein [Proteus]MBI6406610.1 hypothetical protein [Proteus sp. PR00208]
MKIYFDKLAKFLPANDKRENVVFLLSEKIANCLNSLPNDNFFILKHKISNVYVDKNFFTEIKNELTDVINKYIEGNIHHLDKINKANNKCGGVFLDRENINCLTVINLNSLDTVQKFIETIISETGSSSLKDKILNKDNNPAINLFFEKGFLCRFERKSISQLIKEIKNKIIELNPGCNLPFIIGKKEYIFVKLGNVEAANNQVKIESKDDNNIKICFNKDNNSLNKEKIESALTKFEISFNFLNENINKLYDVINKYYKFASLNNANNTFGFIKDGDETLEDINKVINEKDEEQSIKKHSDVYNECNKTCKLLNVFHQDFVKKFREKSLEKNDIDKLSEMIKKIESNTDSLAIELKSLASFSNAYNNYENKIKNKVSNIAIKNSSCCSINEITTKTNECLSLLDGFIKRKETGFLSKVYKFFFPKKHNESLSLLINYKSEINKISSYLNSYKEKNEYFTINDISLMVTSRLSKINYPESLLGYLYGEKSKCNNFIQSLFKKDD